MFKTIKNFYWIIASSFFCILLGILTFLTFINQSFIPLNSENLQYLLILDLVLLLIFFSLIFKNFFKLYKTDKKQKIGKVTSMRYVSVFALFTFIPSLMIAIFSLFLFNFGIQNFFNDQIIKAVNNSYDVAKSYSEQSKKNIETDVFLMSVGLNRASYFFYDNKSKYSNIVKSEKLLRRVDDVYLIDSLGNIIFSDTLDARNNFIIPNDNEFNKTLEGLPTRISNDNEDKTSAMIKLNSLIDTYLYISRNIDTQVTKYLSETEQAVNFYYTVINKQTGIKVTFAIIYIIIVTLLLFLSTSIAITFARKLTEPIINLISASENISKGNLDTKVPEIESDEEFEKLNKNFNSMIDRLKKQQDKLLLTERYAAWESVARKLAHEIKNPLTPIQLSIDRLKEKYSGHIKEGKIDFEKYLETINRQIEDIEKLVNEFSSFARMPRPVTRKIDIKLVVNRAVDFIKMSSKNSIQFKNKNENYFALIDEEQMYRVFINLIKNSEESFLEKKANNPHFKGIIDIEIDKNNDYIFIRFVDNGTGIADTKKVMTPYFTTKKTGTGLGLAIVSKIINEHSGDFNISNNNSAGINITISLPSL